MSGDKLPPERFRDDLGRTSDASQSSARRESRLRGGMAAPVGNVAVGPAAAPKRGRLRGDMVRGIQPPRAESVAVAHAPTWELEFGNKGTGYGDLGIDGFAARNSNHASGQDAFAVSADRKRFAVADGLGGATDAEGTRFLSKYIADAAVQQGVDTFFDPEALTNLYGQAEDAFEAQSGRRFTRPRIRSHVAGTVATTLTYAEVLNGEQVRIVAIGDSPAFVTDSSFTPVAQYGEDAQSGTTDAPLAFKLGIDMQGKPLVPRREQNVGGIRVVDTIVAVPRGSAVAIGSDYFSDTVREGGRFGQLADFVGQTPAQFHESTRSIGKPDDATLITLIPDGIAGVPA